MNRKQMIDLMQQSISEAVNAPYTKMFKLAAIWMERPIKTSLETKRRITEGDKVLIKDGKLLDCNEAPTHVIRHCHGTMANNMFTITVENLITNELSIVQL